MKRASWVLMLCSLLILTGCTPSAGGGTSAPVATPAIAVTAATGETPATVVAPAAAERVLKLGVLGPYTGANARVGEEFKGSVQMAFDEIGNKIGDYKVELVWIDGQGDPEKATRAYEEAVLRTKIDAGILQWQSSVAVAVMEVVANNKVPHFFGFGATEVVNQKYASDPVRYSYWMGKTWPSPVKLSAAYVETLEQAISQGVWSPPAKTVGIFGEDTDWGRSFGAGIKGQLEAAGWTTVSEDYFTRGETEFYPLLNRLKDQKVALIAGTANSPSTESLVKQAKEVGLNSLIIMDGMGWVGTWYELCGDACDYVLDQIPQWTTDEAKAFRDDFTKKYGFEPSPSAGGLAYDMTRFFIRIANRTLEKYGELSRETLYKVGQEELWTGQLTFTRADGAIIMEEYKYDATSVPDPVVGQGKFVFPVIQYFKGEGKVIWPDIWKTTELQIPESMK